MSAPLPWISVKDELPEDGEVVLVCICGDGYRIAWRSCKVWCVEGRERVQPTHWMRVAPPKEDQ